MDIKVGNISDLSGFMFFKDFYSSLNTLEELAQSENWQYSTQAQKQNTRNPILENYVHHTFRKLLAEYKQATTTDERQKIIYFDGTYACFNTGLFTQNYNAIFAYFRSALKPTDRKPFVFNSFEQESSYKLNFVDRLPQRAKYFTSVEQLIYDVNLELRHNIEHILQENKDRFPAELSGSIILPTLFTGAVELAKKRVQANYKTAVPTYFRGDICLMLPLCLSDPKKTDLALAIRREEKFYVAKTVLTLDMAYNDARLIAKPDVDWLTP